MAMGITIDPGEFDFDASLEAIEIPFRYKGIEYVLREPTGDVACKYRNAMTRSVRFNNEGKITSTDGLADVEPLLVSMCAFTRSDNKPVTQDVVRSWPSRMVKRLYEKAKEIGALGLEMKESEAKN